MLFCCWSGETRGDSLGHNEIACQSWALCLHSSICECSAMGRWKVYSWKENRWKKPPLLSFYTGGFARLVLLFCILDLYNIIWMLTFKKKFISYSIWRECSLLLQRPPENTVQLLLIVVLCVDKTSKHTLFHHSLLLACFWNVMGQVYILMGHRDETEFWKIVLCVVSERVLCGWRKSCMKKPC